MGTSAKLQWIVLGVALLLGVAFALLRGPQASPARLGNNDLVFVRDLAAQSRSGMALARTRSGSPALRDFAAEERRQLGALRSLAGSSAGRRGAGFAVPSSGSVRSQLREHLDADRLIARIELGSGTEPTLRSVAATVERAALAQLRDLGS